MKKRKIAIVTGTRAEFGLLYWLIKAVHEDENLILQLLVTGMHLSPEFGLTYKAIEESGFPIAKKIETLLSSDSSIGISKAMGLGMISFSEALDELKPDILVVLGDRFEIFAAAAAATIERIPIAHIHGGEVTEGVIDEPMRHSITKMAHLHFTATEEYRKRVIQLGEQPDRVFNVGTPGLDNVYKLTFLNRKEFEKVIDWPLGEKNAVVTFHPVTLEENTSKEQFEALLEALDDFPNLHVIFTKPNADTGGRIITQLIEQYVTRHPGRTCAFTSLGQLQYLSALNLVDVVLGNSSSGLIEAPSFQVPTINIGDRQRGRIKADSVIDSDPTKASIKSALEKAFSKEFRDMIQYVENPYGRGGASEEIKEVLKFWTLDNVIKKSFYNL